MPFYGLQLDVKGATMSKERKSHRRFWTDWKIGGKVIGIVIVITLISISVLLVANYLLNVRQTTTEVKY